MDLQKVMKYLKMCMIMFVNPTAEAEPQGEYGYQPQQQPQSSSFLGGQLPVPRCSSSGSADYERSDEIRDIYEEVPTIDRWPLPPLPHEGAFNFNKHLCVAKTCRERVYPETRDQFHQLSARHKLQKPGSFCN